MMKDELPAPPANNENSSIGRELGVEDQHLFSWNTVPWKAMLHIFYLVLGYFRQKGKPAHCDFILAGSRSQK